MAVKVGDRSDSEYKSLLDRLDDLIADYEIFMEDILGVGEENPLGEKILVYEIKCDLIEFYNRKTELLKEIEEFRMHLMKEIPSAYPIYAEILPDIATDIADLEDKGSIEIPLFIKMMLELVKSRIRTAIEVGEPSELLTQATDYEKQLYKLYTNALKKVASKGQRAMLIMQILLDHSSPRNPLSLRDIERLTGRKYKYVQQGIKELMESAPEILRLKLDRGEYKYYIPDRFKRFNVR